MLREDVFVRTQPVSLTRDYNESQENGEYVFVGGMLCIQYKPKILCVLDAWQMC